MKNIRKQIQEQYPDDDLLFMDEFDKAILGIAEGKGMKNPVIAYDYDKVIEINMKWGMTRDEAIEYLEYNQKGAYVGKYTPIFVEKVK